MNISENYEELKGLEIKIKSDFEVKEEPIENYNEGFCDEENLNSDSLKPQDQTNEPSIYNSSSADPNWPVKIEDDNFKKEIDLDCEVKMEHSLLDEYERKMKTATEDEMENDYIVKEEGVFEENEDVSPETEKETNIPFFGLTTTKEIQFQHLEYSEIPKGIVCKANVKKNKVKTKTNFNNGTKGGVTNLSLNSSKVENKKHCTMNLDQDERIDLDQMETGCSQQESPISSPISRFICEYQTASVKDLKSHLSSHSKMFKCSECDFSSNYKCSLKIHLLSHLNQKLFKCSECNYSCKQKSNLKTHLLSHSTTKLFKCSECDFSSNYKSCLKKHLLSHLNYKLFKCSECNYSCMQKSSLKIHLLSHSTTKLFKCSECDYACNRKDHLKKHLLTHLNGKLFKCSVCDYSCIQKCHLKSHLQSHSTTKLFKCSECDYASNRKDHLKTHLLSHLNVLFKCSECDYSSNNKKHLKYHLLTHSNTMTFKCSECDYVCNKKKYLKNHLLSHLNAKFKCSLCDYSCIHKCHLKRHLQSHSTTKLFNCSECDYASNRKDHLKRHLLSHLKKA